MKREYIPILVDVGQCKELWRIDVTNLSITQLIELRNTIISYTPYDKTIQVLDGIIKRDVETIIPSHNIRSGSYIKEYKKSKKQEKQKRKIKNMRRKYDKHKR